jgi:hypothetical protein
VWNSGVTIINDTITEDSVKALGYADGIWYDDTYGSAGSDFPFGTRSQPVNNWSDLIALASTYGVRKIRLTGFSYLVAEADTYDMTFEGDDAQNCCVDADGYDLSYCEFRNLALVGDWGDSWITAVNCVVSLSNIQGSLTDCSIATVSVNSGSTLICFKCSTATDEAGILGVGDVILHGWKGDLEFSQRLTGGTVIAEVVCNTITLTNTVSGGATFYLSGIARVNDLFALTHTIYQNSLVTPYTINSFLATQHGAGNWEGATASEIDTELTAQHGAGSWVKPDATELAQGVLDADFADYTTPGTIGWVLSKALRAMVEGNAEQVDQQWIIYDPDDPETPLVTFNTTDENGNPADVMVYKREKV